MNHSGKVTCRGMLIEETVYRTGETLAPRHKEMVLFMFKDVIDLITTNGWISIGKQGTYFVLFSVEKPPFFQ